MCSLEIIKNQIQVNLKSQKTSLHLRTYYVSDTQSIATVATTDTIHDFKVINACTILYQV